MPSTAEIIGITVLVMGGLGLAARWDRDRPDPVGGASRNLRGLAVALICFAATAPLTAIIALLSSNTALPVKPPGSSTSCSGSSSSGGEIVLLFVLTIAAIRLVPALVGFLVARRRSAGARPVVGGRQTLVVAGLILGLVCLLAATRVVMGGFAPKEFTTYGAVTPPGAKGWRARAVIQRHQVGKLRLLTPGGSLASDRAPGRSMSGGPRTVPGLKVWIGGAPVNLVYVAGGGLAVQAVSRSISDPARRPHFDRMPKLARTAKSTEFLLVGRQFDDTWMAIKTHISPYSVSANGARRADVGLLLRPPALPLLAALFLAALGLGAWFLTRVMRADKPAETEVPHPPTRRTWGHIARLAVVALYVETSLLLYGAYRIYF